MNLIQATVCAVIVRTGYFHIPNSSPWHQLIDVALDVNVMLFVFNLLPVPPLDGSNILANILPENMARGYISTMARWGRMLFFLVIIFGGQLIGPEVNQIRYWLAAT